MANRRASMLFIAVALLFGGCNAADPTPPIVVPKAPVIEVPTTPTIDAQSVDAPSPSALAVMGEAPRAATAGDTAEPSAEPSATGTPAPVALSVAEPPPLPDLDGRIVWVDTVPMGAGLPAAVELLEPRTGHHATLWAAAINVHTWAVAPATGMAAYMAADGVRSALVVRQLVPGAEGVIVAREETSDASIAAPIWHPDGEHVGYVVHRQTCPDELEPSPCAYRVVDASGRGDAPIWSGDRSTFPYACHCDFGWYWEPALARVALFEHPFESTFSREVAIVEQGSAAPVGRLPLATEFHARTQSPDRVWVALLDSASYYGSSFPLADRRYAAPEEWPGEAHVRLFNVQSGGLVDLGSWPTAVGFTHPVWSPDGTWLAFAEPTGAFLEPTPVPTIAGYPEPPPARGRAARGEFEQSGTIVWALTRDGAVTAKIVVPNVDAWPLAISPNGEHVLIGVHDARVSVDVQLYRIADGAGGHLATVPGGPTVFSWLP